MYLWEAQEWPDFYWDERRLSKLLGVISLEQGRHLGKMEVLGFELRSEAHLHTLTEDVTKSSEIDGENLERDQVRSSIACRLGMDIADLPADRDVEGVVATTNYGQSLTDERLFTWHAALFTTGLSGMTKINVGIWRDDADGPMQVASGPMAGETVHYEAPPAERVGDEMKRFLEWFENPGDMHPLLMAGLAHLSLVTIHPFDDGNGRIGRAISDRVLARSEKSPQRFYSMSAQIRQEHKDYYNALEWAQKDDVDITHWQDWFLNCLLRAIRGSEDTLDIMY